MKLHSTLESFFSRRCPLGRGDRLLVAFSGGADSTALLWGLTRLAANRGWRIEAAHLDHALVAGSAERARAALAIAQELGVPVHHRRLAPGAVPGAPAGDRPSPRPGCHHGGRAGDASTPPPGRPLGQPRGVEAAARRLRYEYLEEVRRRQEARFVVTAHHADDQVETVLLRLLFGSGVAGLAGIQSVLGRVARPLLELWRRELREALATAGLTPVEDPSNDDLWIPRNRVRRLLLPRLRAAATGSAGDLDQRLLDLATAAGRARAALDRRLARELAVADGPATPSDGQMDLNHGLLGRLPNPHPALAPGLRAPGLEPAAGADGLSVERGRLERLPGVLWPPALAMLHRRAGLAYPPGAAAVADLRRQCLAGGRVGCDVDGVWRWQSDGDRLRLRRRPAPAPAVPTPFAYTLEVPGEHSIPELSMRLRLRRGPVEAWMFRSAERRAGLALPLAAGDRVTVRSRRPGDRIRPCGCPWRRRLKNVLIDRRVPRAERDRLPLLCVGDRVAWVPGVTVEHAFRVAPGGTAWIAELEPS